ncbi:MAG TPA: phosphopantetheine-binding protein, partial [Acidimicrobiia bacterium]|nr:phosphopantetheine-binding protein [Acidimicrobiia bacterium]
VKLFGLRVDLDELERTLAAKGFDAVCAGDDEGLVVAIEGDDHGADAARVVRATTGLPASTVGVATFRALPRLTNGKPDYAAIRRAAAANPTPAAGRTVMPDPATAHGATDRVRARFAEVLGCTVGDIDDDATFVSLGGDSLSYVEMSIVLEEELGHLPADWHVTPVGRLAPVASGRRRRRRLHRLETGVALRALAILLVVGTHAGLFTVRGGAHVLLALAGLNFGRFQYGAALAGDALTPLLRSIARVAVPSVACIAVVAAVTGTYGPANLALVHGRFAGEEWDAGWRTWYIESLVQLLAVVAVPLAIPALRRALRRAPAVAPVAALAFGAAVRFDAVEVARSGVHRIHGTETVLWLFAFGWAAHRAERIHHRLALSALVLVAAPGYSGNPQRDAAITLGLLVMMWVRQVVVPAVAVHAVGTIASASLYIYLTHWQVYPWISEATHPLVAVVASVAFGVAVWRIADPAYGRVEGRVMRMWRARVARPDFESKNRSACGGGMAHHERDADVRGHHEGERRRRAVGGRRRT